ncbi:hypothetical protein Pcinc_026470 [Petrolisthes cinctipes]|uniref:2-(3-amino-3-carboxypropyl)histidine synthase subunit 2 n=1 Tax=Petrolisthes cinctipes TaxID=88211 RepID=A0AAE1KBK9_PETCI|nr:hypothetical protein Pcinc_026470 [Petrolisthes cinctipes]
MAALTNSGEEAVRRELDTDEGIQASSSSSSSTFPLHIMYETERCVRWIQQGGYKKVCLQFPDELLCDAVCVSESIMHLLGQRVYILADTTYSSCCVDETAAQRVGADAVIHFGRTCLSPPNLLPVLYILTRLPVDVDSVVEALCGGGKVVAERIVLLADSRCYYAQEENIEGYEGEENESLGPIPKHTSEEDSIGNTIMSFVGRRVTIPSGTVFRDYACVYIGPDGPSLTALLLRFPESIFYQVDPVSGQVSEMSGIKLVMSRSIKLELARDAGIIGLVVGTVGVSGYVHILARLRRIIRLAGKRCYTLAVGKPNEPKLANFSEIDAFVYVACPGATVVHRGTDPALARKLLTPWELEVALLPGREWTLEQEVDFCSLLPGGRNHIKVDEEGFKEEVAGVSLLSNHLHTIGGRTSQGLDDTSGSVMVHASGVVAKLHQGGGGEVLVGRTWSGLDPSIIPPTPTGVVMEGMKGLAAGYTHEK